MKVMLV